MVLSSRYADDLAEGFGSFEGDHHVRESAPATSAIASARSLAGTRTGPASSATNGRQIVVAPGTGR
jgi:hypothetical protein